MNTFFGKHKPFATIALLLPLILNGCMVSNNAIRSDFNDFNTILHYNQTQQILLNLVRIHFRESTMFLQASSLTASYESSGGANIGAIIEAPASGSAGADYHFASKPTVSYTPVEGRNYVQQFLTEISAETFASLIRSGWPVEELTNLLLENVHLEDGSVIINSRKSGDEPEFEAFSKKLHEAQKRNRLTVFSKNGEMVLKYDEHELPLSSFQFRSLGDIMYAASKNTQTPRSQESRIKKERPNGELTIRVSNMPPKNSLVSVKYSGHYYSIANDDIQSKDTLALLMQLYRIQSAPAGAQPVLTIPAR